MNDEQYANWAAWIRRTHEKAEANRILTQGPKQTAWIDMLIEHFDEADRDTQSSWGYGAQLADEVVRLRAALTEHHAAGAMDGALVGDQCPVCAALAQETNQ